jgi:hypothetical protein
MAVEERARWTGWAGSPELIAHIARTAETALRERRAVSIADPLAEEPTDFRATVSVGRDAEVFDSPEAFLAEITPEARSGCQGIALTVRSSNVDILVVFVFAAGKQAGVQLTVSAPGAAQGDEVAVIAATVAMAVQRGYRRHYGSVEFSAGLGEGQVGVRAPLALAIELFTPPALGICTGLAIALCLKVFLPDADIPAAAKSVFAFTLAAAYPIWLRRVVPNVELAVDGKTLLYRSVRGALVALLTLLLGIAVKVLIEGG